MIELSLRWGVGREEKFGDEVLVSISGLAERAGFSDDRDLWKRYQGFRLTGDWWLAGEIGRFIPLTPPKPPFAGEWRSHIALCQSPDATVELLTG